MSVECFVFFLVFYWMENNSLQPSLSFCFPSNQLPFNFFSSFSTYWSQLPPLIGHLFNYYSFSKNYIHISTYACMHRYGECHIAIITVQQRLKDCQTTIVLLSWLVGQMRVGSSVSSQMLKEGKKKRRRGMPGQKKEDPGSKWRSYVELLYQWCALPKACTHLLLAPSNFVLKSKWKAQIVQSFGTVGRKVVGSRGEKYMGVGEGK